jgi:hypothetical protein
MPFEYGKGSTQAICGARIRVGIGTKVARRAAAKQETGWAARGAVNRNKLQQTAERTGTLDIAIISDELVTLAVVVDDISAESVFTRQCLKRRIPDIGLLRRPGIKNATFNKKVSIGNSLLLTPG